MNPPMSNEPTHDAALDHLVRMVATACGARLAVLGLVDRQRLCPKASLGLADLQAPLDDLSPLLLAVRTDEPLLVPDATRDPRLATHPQVTAAGGIRFVAALPVTAPGGERVGLLCALDTQARDTGPELLPTLRDLAQLAGLLLAQRRDERERVQAASRDSDRRLARGERIAGVGSWEMDLRTQALRWSAQTCRMHGVAEDHVPTLDEALAALVPESRPAFRAAIGAAIEHGRPWDLELEMHHDGGGRRWVRCVGERERGPDGQPLRLVGTLQDISSRKMLELQLAESERFMREITDHLPMRVAYVDRDLRYRFVNEAHCQRFGLDRNRILGRSRAELLGRNTEDEATEAARRALRGRAQRIEFDEVVHDKAMRVEAQIFPDVGPDGQVRGLVTIGTDISVHNRLVQRLRELGAIVEGTTDLVVQTDRDGRVTYMNPAARQFVGLPDGDDGTRHHYSEFNTAEANRLYTDIIGPALRTQDVWAGQTTVVGQGRASVPVSLQVMAHRNGNGTARAGRFTAVMRDVSDMVLASQALELQAATLRSILEAVPALVVVNGADGRFRYVNSAFERWAGMPRDAIVGRPLADVVGAEEAERSRPWIERVLAGETVHFDKHYPQRADDAHLAISFMPLRLEQGQVDGYVMVAQDITRHKHEAVRLLELSQRDALTGLLNRAGFDATVSDWQDSADEDVALLYIDLDRFKTVNDQHGHAVGDEVLRQFGQRLRSLVRPTDAVARIGGDEFAVALAGVQGSRNAHRVAAKIVDAAAQPFDVRGLQLHIGASVGVAFGLYRDSGWDDLSARADAMLYNAKAAGRGQLAGEQR